MIWWLFVDLQTSCFGPFFFFFGQHLMWSERFYLKAPLRETLRSNWHKSQSTFVFSTQKKENKRLTAKHYEFPLTLKSPHVVSPLCRRSLPIEGFFLTASAFSCELILSPCRRGVFKAKQSNRLRLQKTINLKRNTANVEGCSVVKRTSLCSTQRAR